MSSRKTKALPKVTVELLAKRARRENPPLKTPKGRLFSDPRNGKNPVNPIRTCVFDIETTGLNASFGRVLCAALQFYGPDELIVFRSDQYPDWKKGLRANDKDIVSDILAELEKADIVIAHNGLAFDAAFLRTRAIIHGLPPVNSKKIIDPVLLARKIFR
ncbi:MAG: ribonuclease H-like domain-containing protein, partial [Deltaproteobacteria bacterium]